MTLLSVPGAETGLWPRLAAVVAEQQLEAIVLTGCGDPTVLAALATLGLPFTAIDCRPAAVEAARAYAAAHDLRVAVLQGPPARTLAP